jgi:hypothetical protein
MIIYVDRQWCPALFEQLGAQEALRVLFHARSTETARPLPYTGWREFSLQECVQMRKEILDGRSELIVVG